PVHPRRHRLPARRLLASRQPEPPAALRRTPPRLTPRSTSVALPCGSHRAARSPPGTRPDASRARDRARGPSSKRLAARYQNPHVRTRLEQRLGDLGAAQNNVLAIVENEEPLSHSKSGRQR